MNGLDLKYRGARLRQARMSAGLSKGQAVKQFDVRAGLTHPVLIRIEEGQEAPTTYQLQQLCAVYGIKARWLDDLPCRLTSPRAALEALRDDVISEDRFLAFLLIDYPLARRQDGAK